MISHLYFPPEPAFGFLFVLGAIIGSFLNVCVLRIPTQDRFIAQLRTLWERPSQCPRCRADIRWYDNVPIFGWLWLRGRCRNCKMAISPRYPIVEFLNGLLWMLVFWFEVPLGLGRSLAESSAYCDLGPQVVPGLGPVSPEWFLVGRFLLHMVMIEALLVASLIDLKKYIIPDASTLPAMFVALIASATFARLHLVPVWFQNSATQLSFAVFLPTWMHGFLGGPNIPAWIYSHPHLHGLAASVAGLLVGGGIVWLVRILGGWALRQEAMGFGDVILMAMIGAFLGWQPVLIAFFLGCLCATAAVLTTYLFHRQRTIPFGPYLSLGALLAVLYWNSLFERTRHLFELGILLVPLFLVFAVLFAVVLLAMQLVKRALGFTTGIPPEAAGSWRSGDQTWFFKGEFVDRHTGQWRTKDWDGKPAAQGTIHEERWRRNGSKGHRWER